MGPRSAVTGEDHLLDTSLLGRFERFQIEFDRVIEVDQSRIGSSTQPAPKQ